MHRISLLIPLIALSLQLNGAVTDSIYFNHDLVKERLAAMPLHIIEGIWQFPSDGATIVIERDGACDSPESGATANYTMKILRSPVRSILPGTEMGTLTATSKRGVYTASIFTDTDGGSRMIKPKRFILTLNDDGHLSFRKQGKSIKIQLWRLLPYVSRLGIRINDDSPRDLDGCRRVYPPPVNGPIEPRYL